VSVDVRYTTKPCPGCNAEIKATAVFCMDCGTTFSDESVAAFRPAVSDTKLCPDCAEAVGESDAICRFCGFRFLHDASVGAGSAPTPAPMPPTGVRSVGDALGGMSVPAGLALLGALVIAAGSVGPWVDTVLGSLNGTRADGQITLAAAVLAFACTFLIATGKGGRLSMVVALLAGVGAGITAVVDLVDIQHKVEGATLFGAQMATPGWGIYAVIVGAVLVVAGVLAADRQHRAEPK
jgi:hypothetical protein